MAKRPAAARRLTAANLAGLGAERLAQLLMEAGDQDAGFKRRLRLELAAEAGADLLAIEIDKRLHTLATARTRISWRKRPELLRDLSTQLSMIVERLAPGDPDAALLRLMAWFDLHRTLLTRVKDPKGEVMNLFEAAAPALWITVGAASDPAKAAGLLADAIALQPVDYSRWLGAGGNALSPYMARAILADLLGEGAPLATAKGAVRRLADRADDLDLWLSLVSPAERASPDFAAGVAKRLIQAGRLQDARSTLEAAITRPAPSRWAVTRTSAPAPTPAWESASIALLDAEGHQAEAQEMRWALFMRDLSPAVLRDYVARLPDFEDVVALDRAFAHAAAFADFERGLGFLMDWPAHREAAGMVLARPKEARRPMPASADWAARLGQKFHEAADHLTAG